MFYAGVWTYATRLLTDYKFTEYTERSTVAAGGYVTYQPAAGKKGLVTWAYNPATTGLSESVFDGTNSDPVSVFSSAAGRCSTAIGTVALNSRYARLGNGSGSAQLYALTVLMFG